MSDSAPPNLPAPDPLVVLPARTSLRRAGRRLVLDRDGVSFRTPLHTTHVAYSALRFVRRGTGTGTGIGSVSGAAVRSVHFATTGQRAPEWPVSDDDWLAIKALLERLAPLVPIDPPPPKARRIAADAALRTGDDPAESLRSVRRAMVGRWWVQVRPWAPGFRAEAHTISGPASVWAGELRPSLAEATADAIAMIDELRLTG